MNLTYEQVKDLCNQSSEDGTELSVSTLFSNHPGSKRSSLQFYRQWQEEKQSNTATQSLHNKDLVIAIKRFSAAVNKNEKNKLLLAEEVENALLTEIEQNQLVAESQYSIYQELEQKLIDEQRAHQKTLDELALEQQSHQLTKQEVSSDDSQLSAQQEDVFKVTLQETHDQHQTDMAQLSLTHANEMNGLKLQVEKKIALLTKTNLDAMSQFTSNAVTKVFDLKAINGISAANTPENSSQSHLRPSKKSEEILFSLKSWPDFSSLSHGKESVKLTAKLISKPMSLQEMTDFLGDDLAKEALTPLINELSSMGLLIVTPASQAPKPIVNNNVQTIKTKQLLFKRIRSSLGI